MGFMNKFVDVPLSSPKNNIVAIEDRFVFQQPITLLLREKVMSISGDDYTIKDINDVSYFKCSGKTFNLKDKKILSDINGKPLLNIKNNKIISLKKKMYIYAGEDDTKTLAVIRPNSALIIRKCSVEFFNKATGKNEELIMKTDLLGNSCGIFYGENEKLICNIHRKINAKLALFAKDTYYVEIASGVDVALMLSLGICFDELKNDKAKNSN